MLGRRRRGGGALPPFGILTYQPALLDVGAQDTGLYFCHICQRELTNMSDPLRMQHVNRCCDNIEEQVCWSHHKQHSIQTFVALSVQPIHLTYHRSSRRPPAMPGPRPAPRSARSAASPSWLRPCPRRAARGGCRIIFYHEALFVRGNLVCFVFAIYSRSTRSFVTHLKRCAAAHAITPAALVRLMRAPPQPRV